MVPTDILSEIAADGRRAETLQQREEVRATEPIQRALRSTVSSTFRTSSSPVHRKNHREFDIRDGLWIYLFKAKE